MASRKDYRAVAAAINRIWLALPKDEQPSRMTDLFFLIEQCSETFARGNPRFSPSKFRDAALAVPTALQSKEPNQ